MNMLLAAAPTFQPTASATVLFDSAAFRHHAPDFGTHANPDRPTVEDLMAYWDGVTAARKAELAAKEDARSAMLAEARTDCATWMTRPKGYTLQDQADYAAGILIGRDEHLARLEVEEEMALLNNQPADVYEESLYAFEA